MDVRQERINKRFKLLYYLIIILALTIISVVFVREYLLLRQNSDFFNEQIIEDARENIKIEVDSRVEEITGVQDEIYDELILALENQVKQMNLASMTAIEELMPLATLEEKQAFYVEMAHQANLSGNENLFFILDTTGLSYLSGLAKDIEGTDISGLQDQVTGNFFIQEMIDTVLNSDTNDGIVSYYWIKEVGGEHIKKTSYLYYNEDLNLVLASGIYEVDYIESVQDELFLRISDYEYSDVDYIYIFGYDGEIIFHISDDFTTDDLMMIDTVDGTSFHNTIVETLETEESLYLSYIFEFNEKEEMKTGYIRKIETWDMYLGRSFTHEELLIEQDDYLQGILLGFILYNVVIILLVTGFTLLIRKNFVKSVKDVKDEFDEQNQLIKKMSFRDQLTNLFNRTYFEDYIKNYKPCPSGVGVVMIDVDGLKLINDAYGHSMGDLVLKSVSDTLREVYREGESFRWGGDEFLVVHSNISTEDLEYLSKQFSEEIAKRKVNHIQLSASLGYSRASSCDDNVYDLIKKAEEMMYDHKIFSSSSIKSKMINSLLDTLYDSYNFEKQHAQNVEKYALMIGKSLKLSEEDLHKLSLSSLLHDIGKISIPGYLLTKEEKLTDAEFAEIKLHSEKGHRILSAYSELTEYAVYVLSHHEKWDGSGYPRGLSKKDIPLFSRIICIADAFDAMTQDRVYKKKITREEAIDELLRCKATQFDPSLVDIFVEAIRKK